MNKHFNAISGLTMRNAFKISTNRPSIGSVTREIDIKSSVYFQNTNIFAW